MQTVPKPNEIWRYSPDWFAEKVSMGRWRPFNYLVHIADICRDAINDGNGRIILTVPPRHGKSTFISHWLPTWFLELFPDKKVMVAAYQAEFAKQWGRLIRNSFDHNKHILNTRIAQDSKAANRFHTLDGGEMIASGLDGGFTGKGGDLIIIDDPIKNPKEANSKTYRNNNKLWYEWVIENRTEPNATIIVLMTRWHHDDLVGWLLKERKEDGYRLINFPAECEYPDELGRKPGDALCPERFDENALKRFKRRKKSWISLYQQRPTEEGGEIWNSKWWRFFDADPVKKSKEMTEVVQSWDFNFKGGEDADFVVGTCWGRKTKDFYLFDEARGQWDFRTTKRKVLMFSTKWDNARRKILERAANGEAIENELRSVLDGLELVTPKGTKEERAQACQPEIEAGCVYLPNPNGKYAIKINEETGEEYNWVEEFIDECSTFPAGQYDDRVDSSSQALLELKGDKAEPLLFFL